MKILVTGGCGFIGSHLVDRLILQGHKVRVYDLLEPQVHQGKMPSYLNKGAEYIFADVRDKDNLKKALRGIEAVVHYASQVGMSQSMYQIQRFIDHNCLGTSVLLDLIVNTKNRVKKIVVASSNTIYGEGAYECKKCGRVYPEIRNKFQLKRRDFQIHCPKCKHKVLPIATSEDKPLAPSTIYASTKRIQEEMCLMISTAYRIPVVSLRYFNVYGPRQSLSNPYTGVSAIFLSRVKNNRAPLIFEDGRQSRDFVHVQDIVQATILAIRKKEADYDVFNVGTGTPVSILDMAKIIISVCKKKITPRVLKKSRAGDIRHCFADISKIQHRLGFKIKISQKEGIRDLIHWSQTQEAYDLSQKAQKELKIRGLSE